MARVNQMHISTPMHPRPPGKFLSRMRESISLASSAASWWFTLHGPSGAATLCRWPLTVFFPTTLSGWISNRPQPSGRPPRGHSNGGFPPTPRLAQISRSPVCPGHLPRFQPSNMQFQMVADRGINFLKLSGWPNSSRFEVAQCSGTGAECVDAATLQHVGRTASMVGCTRQSRAAAPFTAWLAFLHYGCCGPYGSMRRCVRGSSDGSCPGFIPDNYHLELLDDHHQ